MVLNGKKRKLKAAAEPDEPVIKKVPNFFEPNLIPIEIWRKIFSYIAFKELPVLSLVCKTFYGAMISMPKVMNKVALKLNSTTLQETILILKSPRIYINIELEDIFNVCEIEICKIIIRRFKDNITILKFEDCEIRERDFIEILKMTQKNLTKLKVVGKLFQEVEDEASTSIIVPKTLNLSALKEVTYVEVEEDPYPRFLDLMPNTLLKLSGKFENDVSGLMRFLERQIKLKEFYLSTTENTTFLDSIDSTRINCKLRKLEIESLENTIASSENLDRFLMTQAASLKELSLVGVSVNLFHDSFNNMPNLQYLKFIVNEESNVQYESGDKFNCPSLKKLVLEFEEGAALSFMNFINRFPNVQEIDFLGGTNHRIIQTVAANHPNLKKITERNYSDDFFNAVTFNNLTTLEVFKLKENQDDNDEVEESFDCAEFQLENLVYAAVNLEVLILYPSALVTGRCLLQILFHFKKLKHLQIQNGDALTDAILCRYFELFKNLQTLEILFMPEPAEKFMEAIAACENTHIHQHIRNYGNDINCYDIKMERKSSKMSDL